MNKWLKIGSIVGAAVVGVAALGVAAYSFLPMPASAQGRIGSGDWGRGPEFGEPGFGRGGFSQRGPEFGSPEQFGFEGFRGGFGDTIDREALLADALGITIEELQAAKEQADLAAVQQVLDEGMISQNQADFISAQIKLRNYIDRDELMAQALGVSAEELQTAREEGTMRELMEGLELDRAEVRTAMTTAYEEAVQQAVTDGVITQEQADVVLSLPFGGPGGPGKGGPGGFGGRGGFGGPGGFGHR